MYTNAASIRNKWLELLSRPESTQADIIALTETWLEADDHIPSSVGERFQMFRQDRGNSTRGGGCLLLISPTLIPTETDISFSSKNVSVVVAGLKHSSQNTLFACVYRGPGSSTEEDKRLLDALESCRARSQRVIIVGDFNIPEVDWTYQECPVDAPGEKFLLWLQDKALYQHVYSSTRFRENQRPSLLDLIFTSNEGDVSSVDILAPLGKSDHTVICFTLHLHKMKSKPKMSRNFGRMDKVGLLRAAEGLNWVIPPASHLEERWQNIKENLRHLQDYFAPLSARRRQGKPPWWKPKFRRALTRRDQAWRRYKETSTSRDWAIYKARRNAAVSMQRELKKEYERRLPGLIAQNPKAYYGYVQSKRSLRGEIGALDCGSGDKSVNDREKAEAFCRFFTTVHREDLGQTPPPDADVSVTVIPQILIMEETVLATLKALRHNKAPGPDGIHAEIITPIAELVCRPITELFRQSLEDGSLPTDWKTATVTPIHKSGKRDCVRNYRPVSLTCILCKALETIMRMHICSYLDTNNLLSKFQHGFIKGRSCLSNLLCFLDEVTKRLDEGKPVEICYVDFSKAFDSVNHRLLLHKLKLLGINGQIYRWLADFLDNRKFCVRVGEKLSHETLACSGVPQGSILGPILFIVFVNDLLKMLECPVYAFADDVKIVSPGTRQTLVNDVKHLVNWAQQWDMPLNVEKCHLLTHEGPPIKIYVGENAMEINPTTRVRDLGIYVTSDYKWGSQCQEAARKARNELFRLKSALTCREPDVFLPLYKAFVRPHMEYCVQAWSPYLRKDINCVEKVQRLATKMIPGLNHVNYEDRLRTLDLFSMERRRLRGDLIETFKITKGFTNVPKDSLFNPAPRVGTRGHQLKLKKPHSRLQLRANFFSVRVINAWNKLPNELVNLNTVECFKKTLDRKWKDIFGETPV